ncbi:MAG: formylglycine-generating enzyme family protein [Chloroflexota bacterium]
MAWIPGGIFMMGADEFYPEEAPAHEVAVDGFWMQARAVTNEEYMKFVNATGFKTFAEKVPKAEDYPGAPPSMLVPGSLVFVKPRGRVDLNNYQNWWQFVPGADWRHPVGPKSSIRKLRKHPVVHINYEDALAYAEWAGYELPTEAQWEFAARGGLEKAIYTWGNGLRVDGKMMANTWQGEFPWQNLVEDGYEGTAPVGSFPPNAYGLYDMAGNVWEWTSDWFSATHPIDTTKSCCTPQNPRGANMDASYDPAMPHVRIPRKVIKGGSYLCAPNYCLRYRPAARSPEMIDSATNHLGFRCVINI